MSSAFNIQAKMEPTTTTITDRCSSCDSAQMENEQLKAQIEVMTQVNWQLTTKLFALEQWKSAMEFQMSQPALFTALAQVPKLDATPITPSPVLNPKDNQTVPTPPVPKLDAIRMTPSTSVVEPKEAPLAPLLDMVATQSPFTAFPAPKYIKTKMVTVCTNCGLDKTTAWRRRNVTGEILCNPCGLYEKMHKTPRPIIMKSENIARRYGRRSGPAVSNFITATPKEKKTAMAPPPSTQYASSIDEIIDAVARNSAAPSTVPAADVPEVTETERLAAILLQLQAFMTENAV